MTDGDPHSTLGDIESRLQKAREKNQPKASGSAANDSSAIGVALRLGVEFVVGIALGSIIGVLLDKWLGTSPWLFLVFFLLGMGAGFLNVFRAARSMGLTKTDASKAPDQGENRSETPDRMSK
jgi:ATP synthase protein I